MKNGHDDGVSLTRFLDANEETNTKADDCFVGDWLRLVLKETTTARRMRRLIVVVLRLLRQWF
jgi:hypothetical protein